MHTTPRIQEEAVSNDTASSFLHSNFITINFAYVLKLRKFALDFSDTASFQ